MPHYEQFPYYDGSLFMSISINNHTSTICFETRNFVHTEGIITLPDKNGSIPNLHLIEQFVQYITAIHAEQNV